MLPSGLTERVQERSHLGHRWVTVPADFTPYNGFVTLVS